MRLVTVRVGAPIPPLAEGREAARVTDLRDRTYEAIAELLRSLGGQVPDVPLPNADTRSEPRSEPRP
jgi:hypothetical protein